ncbi:MAG TPA: ATP synthase F0 subunit B [Pyrinomonadaceae bacterium]|nr:ATP synthase F0 subunit B [Pyrinomonadaceae bacterium]HMP64710.1 ATP synthase F0 subunit B [Pyrinomonadaceae bacterium]
MALLAAGGIQLFPDGTLFIHIGFILIMIWVLNRTLFKPINEVITKRSRQKVGRGGEAEEILADVAEKQKQYERTMLEARTETYEMIERERLEAVEARQTAILSARAEANRHLKDELDKIEKAKADAKVDIALEAHKMADKISANILKA